jgi:sugar lactone lactonase YvrE
VVALDDLSFIGEGLRRPECVLAASNGVLVCADWGEGEGGGVTRILPDGRQERILAKADWELLPNGVALRPDGSYLVTHLGPETGGVFHLARDGALQDLVTEVEGETLPPTNYVLEEPGGRLWITVSTRLSPRDRGYRADNADGFIVVADADGARIAADGLGYTNECQIHPSGDWLYVNETFTRRLSRFALLDKGRLGPKEEVAVFGEGTFPDGLVFDEEGGVWVTSIVSNRVIRLSPEGDQEIVLEDSDPDHLAWVEQAYQAGALGRPHLDKIASRRLMNISSLAFGGPERKTAYLGCLLGESIACFEAPVAGHPPIHWTYPA